MRAYPFYGALRRSFIANRLLLASVLTLSFGSSAFSQEKVDVNYLTGATDVTIPIYTVVRGDISLPVSLQYIGSGVHVNDMDGTVGVGWQLNTGSGMITRQLKDLPDDSLTYGYMNSSVVTAIQGFSIANDNNPATCTDEATDLTYITNNFPARLDREPDIFTVAAPGLNVNLVFNKATGKFVPEPYQDLQISYTIAASNYGRGVANRINQFTIVNDKGVKYIFDGWPTTTLSATDLSADNAFQRVFNTYVTGTSYISTWYLYEMDDTHGNKVTFEWDPGDFPSNLPVSKPDTLIMGNTNTSGLTYNKVKQYTKVNTTTNGEELLYLIIWSGSTTEYVGFQYTNNSYGNHILSSVTLPGGVTYSLTYKQLKATTAKRDYLVSFGIQDCDAKPYQFTYTGENLSGTADALPDSGAIQQDYWGYYNNVSGSDGLVPAVYVFPDNASYPNLERYRLNPIPGYTGTYYQLQGTNRSVGASYIADGSLASMTNPTGGTTTFTYEPNDYWDVPAATTYQGGGIRIKQITYDDGTGSGRNIVKSYSYIDPATSATSGKPISLPQFAFAAPDTLPVSSSYYWNVGTVRKKENISDENTSILYSKVTETVTGAGKTLYEFYTPATYWDRTASPAQTTLAADWQPTVSYVAAPTSGSSCPIGAAKGSVYNYPFSPNTNYDFEQGLPKTTTTYDASGNQLDKIIYTYTRANAAAAVIPGIRIDGDGSNTYYGKYNLYAATSELIGSETHTVNDRVNGSVNTSSTQQSTVLYTYGTKHKKPIKKETDNTDGTTDYVYYQYALDYDTTRCSDTVSTAIKTLQANFDNENIEQWASIKRGGVENITEAQISLYGLFSPGGVNIAHHKYAFSPSGLSGFASSSINTTTGLFNYYSTGYTKGANYNSYSDISLPVTVNDGDFNTITNLYQIGRANNIATFTNTSEKEVLYTGFESPGVSNGAEFTVVSSPGVTVGGRSGKNSMTLPTASSFKNAVTIHPGAQNYYFSVWVNNPSASTTFSITLNNATVATLPLTAATGWKYFRVKVPTSSYAGTTDTLAVKASTSVQVDDLLFYPETSDVTTRAYMDTTWLKTSETDANGISRYYNYDTRLRLYTVTDQDGSIILKKNYLDLNGQPATSSSVITTSTNLYPDATITYTAPTNVSCYSGLFYSWNFGDGTTATSPSATANATTHAYEAAGTYTVTLTITGDYISPITVTKSVTIAPSTITVTVCQSGVYYWNSSGTVTTVTCSGHPTSTTTSYFWIQSTSPTATYTYQWQILYQDISNPVWTNISGATGSSY